uniref:protein LURP-one-related 10-like n=1 Tax=Erigeron canadensis TaxID=72917 RepID=UPI001CB8FE14|nr:protein LURP-one-related 10-like [Erigeron canadensis]
MSQPDVPPVLHPVSVIGHEFIAPYPLEIKVEKHSKESLVITDINNKIILKVKPCDSSFHRQRLLLDANDRPIVKLREKNLSEHKRWNIFRGESKANSDMIFSTKKEHTTQTNIVCVNVYMANKINSKGDCDFLVKGNWSKRSCTVYMGDSSTSIAQMNAVQSLEKKKMEKDKFMVTIGPNVDYAFVVALFVILDAMKNSDTKEVVAGEVVGGVGDVLGAIISS